MFSLHLGFRCLLHVSRLVFLSVCLSLAIINSKLSQTNSFNNTRDTNSFTRTICRIHFIWMHLEIIVSEIKSNTDRKKREIWKQRKIQQRPTPILYLKIVDSWWAHHQHNTICFRWRYWIDWPLWMRKLFWLLDFFLLIATHYSFSHLVFVWCSIRYAIEPHTIFYGAVSENMLVYTFQLNSDRTLYSFAHDVLSHSLLTLHALFYAIVVMHVVCLFKRQIQRHRSANNTQDIYLNCFCCQVLFGIVQWAVVNAHIWAIFNVVSFNIIASDQIRYQNIWFWWLHTLNGWKKIVHIIFRK